MRRFLLYVVVMALMVTLSSPALALEGEDEPVIAPDTEIVTEDMPVVVSDAETLIEAIAQADDGDTIYIDLVIYPREGDVIGSPNKRISIKYAEGWNSIMFQLQNDCSIVNIDFDNITDSTDNIIACYAGKSVFSGCTFSNIIRNSSVIAVDYSAELTIKDSEIVDNTLGTQAFLNAYSGTQVFIEECSFERNTTTGSTGIIFNRGNLTCRSSTFTECSVAGGGGGAISNNSLGTVTLDECTFTKNTALIRAGAIDNHGILSIHDCLIYGNTADVGGNDIYTFDPGSITIENSVEYSELFTDSEYSTLGWYYDSFYNRYSKANAISFSIPAEDYNKTVGLVFVMITDSGEYEYPILAEPPEPVSDPMDDGDGEEPKEPDDELEPTDLNPDDGDGENEPTPAPTPKPTEDDDSQPSEPMPTPDNSGSGDNSHSHHDDDDNDYGGDYTPYTPPKKTETPEASPEPVAVEPVYYPFQRNGVVLDHTSESYLLGYGNGELGEQNPISRAEMAMLIFRMLTPETVDAFRTTDSGFDDVPTDQWYSEAVATLRNAGIVNGVGDNKYNLSGNVTWGELLTFFGRFVELQTGAELSSVEAQNHWSRDFVVNAVSRG
jgi:hypothetical protein